MATFKFGDMVTNAKWLKNEKHIVLNEGIRGGVTVASSRGEVQIVHHTLLTAVKESVTAYPEKLTKTEEQFKDRLNKLEVSVDALLTGFTKQVKEDTTPESKFNFRDSI